MKYRPARWVPPASHQASVVCEVCGIEHFTVFYISEILGRVQCEACLRQQTSDSVTAPDT